VNWGSFENFLHMGGYGAFVWGSYAVAAVLLVAEVVWLRARRRTILQRLGLIERFTRNESNESSA
jgi:heme exporter protein D